MAKVKQVPTFTLGVNIKGNPVHSFTTKAVTVVERFAVTISLLHKLLDLARKTVPDRTLGPMTRTQVTAIKSARLVRVLACKPA